MASPLIWQLLSLWQVPPLIWQLLSLWQVPPLIWKLLSLWQVPPLIWQGQVANFALRAWRGDDARALEEEYAKGMWRGTERTERSLLRRGIPLPGIPGPQKSSLPQLPNLTCGGLPPGAPRNPAVMHMAGGRAASAALIHLAGGEEASAACLPPVAEQSRRRYNYAGVHHVTGNASGIRTCATVALHYILTIFKTLTILIIFSIILIQNTYTSIQNTYHTYHNIPPQRCEAEPLA